VFVGEDASEGYSVADSNGVKVYLSDAMVIADAGVEISLSRPPNDRDQPEFIIRGVLF
jgi:hypothetical protein